MLLAVPIEGFDPDDIYPLGKCLVRRIANLLDPLSRLLSFKNLDTTQDFETQPSWIVNHDERYPVVGQQVAGADVLLIPQEVGESDRSFVNHLQKAFRAASVLNVKANRTSPESPYRRCRVQR